MQKKKFAIPLVKNLRRMIGKSTPAIWHKSPFQTLIATVLSARTKDANTAKAAKQLFTHYPNAKSLAVAPLKKVEKLIRPAGFYRVKAKRVKGIAKKILNEFNGKTPSNMADLLSLPGVGRKTANCVLVFSFMKPAIPVDVHVHRISNRIGLVKTKTPEQTEQALMKLIPKKFWIELNELMVKFGQRICLPRNPRCEACMNTAFCDYYSTAYLQKKG
ncbi:MAG: endonuclease III [Candidatus Diapherotrites archaeon]